MYTDYAFLCVLSHLLDKLHQFKCTKEVKKKLPQCEHSVTLPCHQDPAKTACKEPCGGEMNCCGRTCKSRCFECQKLSLDIKELAGERSTTVVERSTHKYHLCERTLYCQHRCGNHCHPKDQGCNSTCQEQCRQQCDHQKCRRPCSVPCAPCMEPCSWKCSHRSCPVACGSVCQRPFIQDMTQTVSLVFADLRTPAL